jgi:hypothetical protein
MHDTGMLCFRLPETWTNIHPEKSPKNLYAGTIATSKKTNAWRDFRGWLKASFPPGETPYRIWARNAHVPQEVVA